MRVGARGGGRGSDRRRRGGRGCDGGGAQCGVVLAGGVWTVAGSGRCVWQAGRGWVGLACSGGGRGRVSAERARDFPKPPVYGLGAGESVAHANVSQMRDFTTSDSSRLSGQEAFRIAGLGPQDIDHVMFYDAFSFTPMLFLEDLGFVGKGESGPFVSETTTGPAGKVIYKTGPGGAFPMNTNGGGLSYCHTGMYGMFALLESVFQLRGEAGARQLPGLKTSLAHGPGGNFAAAGTVIMSNE